MAPPADKSAGSPAIVQSEDSATPAVRAFELTHDFGELRAVDHVNFDVRRGEVFGLVGPDGAGKSTLIRMLATVLSPSEGDAEVFGASVLRSAAAVKPRIGYMSQRFSLYGDLTVRENVDFFADLRGVPRRERSERAESALSFAGLSAFQNRLAEHLSGGMKQKLALAVTLMHDPDLLLLDEPTTGVDPVSRREFWRIISDLHRRGISVLVATPYMDEAERCSRVAFMDGGRLLLCDTPSAIAQRVPGTLIELSTERQRDAIALLEGRAGVTSVVLFGDAVRVLVAPEGPSAADLAAELELKGVTVRDTRVARMDMEAAFAFLFAESRGGGAS